MGAINIFLLILIVITTSECAKVNNEDESFLENPVYTNYDELTKKFKDYVEAYPNLAKLHSIGRSVENRELWVLEINKNVNNHTLMTPMFKFVANMHGDESVGRQLTIFLAEYLLRNYGKVDRVTKLVDSTEIYLMPSLNPDGYEKSQVRIKYLSVASFHLVILILYYVVTIVIKIDLLSRNVNMLFFSSNDKLIIIAFPS